VSSTNFAVTFVMMEPIRYFMTRPDRQETKLLTGVCVGGGGCVLFGSFRRMRAFYAK